MPFIRHSHSSCVSPLQPGWASPGDCPSFFRTLSIFVLLSRKNIYSNIHLVRNDISLIYYRLVHIPRPHHKYTLVRVPTFIQRYVAHFILTGALLKKVMVGPLWLSVNTSKGKKPSRFHSFPTFVLFEIEKNDFYLYRASSSSLKVLLPLSPPNPVRSSVVLRNEY